MGYIIIIIFIVSAIIYIYITCSFPTLLIISFVLGMLVALAKLLSFRKYRHTNPRFQMDWEKGLTYKQHDTAPSVEEIMRVKKIAEEAERDRKLEERGE